MRMRALYCGMGFGVWECGFYCHVGALMASGSNSSAIVSGSDSRAIVRGSKKRLFKSDEFERVSDM